MKKILFFGLIFLPAILLADTSEFNINLLVGSDTTPPTTPEFSSVTAVATTQIDLVWSTSTDNYLLGGYVLLRDGNHLATTTQTTYIDAGLTASTTYSYEVYAFDSFYNLSSTSLPVATTTLPIPSVVSTSSTSTTSGTSESTGTGTRTADTKSFKIVTGSHDATFTWETFRPTKFVLRWGRDEDYDGGYIINEKYLSQHKTIVNELEPGTKYFYELRAIYPSGSSFVVERSYFKTTSLADLATPANVRGLKAEVINSDVKLSWDGEAVVKIVRNSRFVGVDPHDGVLVFSGRAKEFYDEKALENYATQFYTVFVVGGDGALSSGAVVRVDRKDLVSDEEGENIVPGEEMEESDPEILIPDLLLSDIRFFQGGSDSSLADEKIIFSAHEPILFSLAKDRLPRHLKTILVTVSDTRNRVDTQVFLVRLNKLGTAYEAVIPALNSGGLYEVKVEIFDYERNTVGRYVKKVTVNSKHITEEEETVIFPDQIINWSKHLIPGVLILIGVIYLWFYRRRLIRPTEDNL